MKDFPGTPGTLTGLLLRVTQSVFAAASIASMATANNFFDYFCYLIASMGLQIIWSIGLASLDVYALVKQKVLHSPMLVSLFVVGDWVTTTLSLAAASASGGITVLYFSDLGHCNFGGECQKYQLAVGLAYMSWVSMNLILNNALDVGRRKGTVLFATLSEAFFFGLYLIIFLLLSITKESHFQMA